MIANCRVYNRKSMTPARIAELLAPFVASGPNAGGRELTSHKLSSISTYIDILLRWNARINLTAIRDPEEIITRHFGESLFAARHLFPFESPAGRPQRHAAPKQDLRHLRPPRHSLADVGSGAGFPGIPIKLWAPQVSLTLIESNHKKATFLREVARALTLTDINIQTARAESLPPASFDTVTLRAVERFESILPVAAALVASAGRLALLIGEAQLSQAHALLPTMTWLAPSPIPNSRSRILLSLKPPPKLL